jgi:hypothetical protein
VPFAILNNEDDDNDDDDDDDNHDDERMWHGMKESYFFRIRSKCAQFGAAANWRSLVKKTSLELQSCPLQNPLGLLPLVKCINLKEGT